MVVVHGPVQILVPSFISPSYSSDVFEARVAVVSERY
jgi:hypothetical protein